MSMLSLPAKLDPACVTAIIDTREQRPLDLSPLQTTVSSLPTGDYSIVGLEQVVAIERKSRDDLVACVGRERDRFEREVQRLIAYPVRALLVEATWQDVEKANWPRCSVHASQALGSLLGWIASGLPVVMCGDHERAGRYASRLLFTAARRRWREARQLVLAVKESKE